MDYQVKLDSYTAPNDYEILYVCYEPSQETKPSLELNFWFMIYLFFDNSSYKCVLVLTSLHVSHNSNNE